MSNLIVSVISIALIAVTVLLGTYYGGTMFREYHAHALSSQLINESRQIVGAAAFYITESKAGRTPTQLEDMTAVNVMSDIPKGVGQKNQWHIEGRYVKSAIEDTALAEKVCLVSRRKIGLDAEKNCPDLETAWEWVANHDGEVLAENDPDYEKIPGNKHCLRPCLAAPGDDRTLDNPLLDPGDPCCMDNYQQPDFPDPVYPGK